MHGYDSLVPIEEQWTANPSDETIQNDVVMDNATWAAMIDSWVAQMW
jgi:hypothetical protein